MKKRVTILGTGRMGAVLARTLHARGHAVTVWNRTASRAAPLAAQGLRVASSVEDAVAGADLVIGNVLDYPATRDLLSPAATSALRDAVFVQLATGTPRQARELAAWAREQRIRYLDGAIMATPEFIGQPGCTILYAGPRDLYDAHAEVFAALGGNALHVGEDIGHAGALDAAILVVLWASLLGAWQAAAICEGEGFPVPAFASALAATMPVLDGSIKDTLARVAGRRFEADAATAATANTCHASVKLIAEISREHGIHPALMGALETVFERGVQGGHGGDDLATVYRILWPGASRDAQGERASASSNT